MTARRAGDEAGRTGFLLALGSFLIWGLGPVYFKALGDLGPLEILAHRVLWTVVLLIAVMTAIGHWRMLLPVLRRPRRLAVLLLTTLLISANWLIFIWAILSGHILQGSLAYYINPLLNVALGTIFLRERLTRVQLAAVLLAGLGVLNLVVSAGVFPWVALSLAGSFGAYALLRRQVQVDALTGLLVETAMLVPIALGYLIVLAAEGAGRFGQGWGTSLLLMLSGFVTGVPLLLFVAASKRLRFITIGLMQYLAPTIQFALALFIYGEELTPPLLITFATIWVALGLYSWETMAVYRRTRLAGAAAGPG